MSTNQWLHGYFAKLNPVAEKIAFDMSEVISAYDHVWLTLNPAEQDNILNDTIIKPEITIRYYNKPTSKSQTSKEESSRLSVQNRKKGSKCQDHDIIYTYDRLYIYTFIHQNVGFKILHDEHIGDYRDEHSFPFSYKTKSQLNLSEIGKSFNIPDASVHVSPKKIPPIKKKSLTEPEPNEQKQIILLEEEPKRRNSNNCTKAINVVADEKLNLLGNFGSKNTLLSISSDSNDFENDSKEQHSENCKLLPEKVQMPKGFDFLSNW